VGALASRKFKSTEQRDHAVDVDDFIQEAWIRALSAASRFDPARGVKLRSFASVRISRGLQDFLRAIDPLSRTDRKLVKLGKLDTPVFVPLRDSA
jgi:RNA polymerase sigma factor for flagellar operon FliA